MTCSEQTLQAALIARGHNPLQVSLLVYGADDLTDRLALADPALAKDYTRETTREERKT